MFLLGKKTKRKKNIPNKKSNSLKIKNSNANIPPTNLNLVPNLQNYLLDFFDIEDYFTLRRVNKKFKNFIENKNSFRKLIDTIKEIVPKKEKFFNSIYYESGCVEFFNQNEMKTFKEHERDKINKHLFSRIFNNSIEIILNKIHSNGYNNLGLILMSSENNILNFKVKLEYIHFYHFDKTMRKLINVLSCNKTIKHLDVVDISNGHTEYFRSLLKNNKSISSLCLKVKNEKLHNFDFDFISDENSITDLKLKGNFIEQEQISFLNLFKNKHKKIKSLDLSDSQGLLTVKFLRCMKKISLEKNSLNLVKLNLSNLDLKTQELTEIKGILKNTKKLKEILIDLDKCENKKTVNDIMKIINVGEDKNKIKNKNEIKNGIKNRDRNNNIEVKKTVNKLK
jgi:hypothetical protein